MDVTAFGLTSSGTTKGPAHAPRPGVSQGPSTPERGKTARPGSAPFGTVWHRSATSAQLHGTRPSLNLPGQRLTGRTPQHQPPHKLRVSEHGTSNKVRL